ncbi:unnamed protein product [Kuraishia capsulata CBS 1993]|uniref:Uncharacterized protein n=1 Tax=Kuraishia capsulata CBS 1993 TaxID=1382522 RepID=W6MQE9_9ASCO|nr:uncharacterized protein KUCA_T00004516001 [Kuraishia capsulata CBS 1993]CDK28533.1 unnamed protein product [Kuraishia capsulata CBS 1993]
MMVANTLKQVIRRSREVAEQFQRHLEALTEEFAARHDCGARGFRRKRHLVRIPVRAHRHNPFVGECRRRFHSSHCGFAHAYFTNVLQIHISRARSAQNFVARTLCESFEKLLYVPRKPAAASKAGFAGHYFLRGLVGDPNVTLQLPGLGPGFSIPWREDPVKKAVETMKVGLMRMGQYQVPSLVSAPTKPHPGSMKAKEAYAVECLALARCTDGGACVDFNVALAQNLQMPKTLIMDDDVIQSLKTDLECYQIELDAVYADIEMIKNSFGSLFISLEEDGTVIRVHFPNCDVEKCEMLMREIGVTRGTVKEFVPENGTSNDMTDLPGSTASSSFFSSFSSMSDSELLDGSFDSYPLLSSPQLTDASSVSSRSVSERDYFPLLSSTSPSAVIEDDQVTDHRLMMDLVLSGNDGSSGLLYVNSLEI